MRFELREAEKKGALVWIALLALIAAPFPLWFVLPHVPAGFPAVERGVPMFWLLFAAGLLVLGRIAVVSWPFAALLAWAVLRGAWHSFPPRTIQLLTVALFAGLLYAAARVMPDREARWAAWAVVLGASWEGLLGLLNTFEVYPWMTWVGAEHVGKPMGLLTHPNYWGSWMALSLPVLWALCGAPVAAVVFVLIAKTISGGPVISAAVGALVMAWPLFGQRVRLAVAGAGAGSIALVMTLHEWRLSGRREVWAKAFEEMRKWPLTGQGLGEWRSWADQYNQALYRPQEGKTFFITLQAHSEPLQLVFELGLIGLVLGGCWVAQAAQASRAVWRAAPAAILPLPAWPKASPWLRWIAFGRAPLERAWIAVLAVALVNSLGSPVFHLPAQAAVILFALARVQADAAALGTIPMQSVPVLTHPRTRKGRIHEPHASR
jgi:hypothetical protein